MYRFLIALALVASALSALRPMPSHAQDNLTVISISEAQINAAIQDQQGRFIQLSALVVDLKPNTMVVTGAFVGTRGNSYTASLTIVPQSVEENFIGWSIVEFASIGTNTNPNLENVFTNLFMGAWRGYEALQFGTIGDVVSVSITETTITYGVSNTNDDTIDGTWDLANGTLTLSEAEVNASLDVLSDEIETQPFTNQYIDFQPGQVVITGLLVPDRPNIDFPVFVTAVFAPIVATDGVAWELVSLEGFEAPARFDLEDAEITLGNEWAAQATHFVGEDYQVTDVAITDDDLIFSIAPR